MTMRKKRVKEAVFGGDYNPDRSLSFSDMIVAELESRMQRGQLAPVIYNKGVDLTRRIGERLGSIYRGERHGLATAVNFIINKCR
jgi:hypothetical protein